MSHSSINSKLISLLENHCYKLQFLIQKLQLSIQPIFVEIIYNYCLLYKQIAIFRCILVITRIFIFFNTNFQVQILSFYSTLRSMFNQFLMKRYDAQNAKYIHIYTDTRVGNAGRSNICILKSFIQNITCIHMQRQCNLKRSKISVN